jgi:hypothetical protein
MHISLKTITGRSITLDVVPSDTIASVKEQLQDKEEFRHVQSIIFERETLEDDRRLSDYNLGPESALFIIIDHRARLDVANAAAAAEAAAAPLHSLKQILVQDPVLGDKVWTLAVEEETTVKEVNEMMMFRTGDPCWGDGRVRLLHRGTALVEPEKTLCEYGIRINSSKLFVVPSFVEPTREPVVYDSTGLR